MKMSNQYNGVPVLSAVFSLKTTPGKLNWLHVVNKNAPLTVPEDSFLHLVQRILEL